MARRRWRAAMLTTPAELATFGMFLYELGVGGFGARHRPPDELAVSGDTPIIEDRPSNAAAVRARNAAKLQNFQRRRQNDAGEIDDLKRSVSYPKSSARATKHAMA
jgi:hypothetical protein